jgi:hypothetical protein
LLVPDLSPELSDLHLSLHLSLDTSLFQSTMKIVRTLILAPFCCAAAFGLHGPATTTSLKKNVFSGLKTQSPMVQAIDIHGGARQVTNMVSWRMHNYLAQVFQGCLTFPEYFL